MDSNPIERVEARLERIEIKLDDHLQRVSKAETDISWLRGHVQIATTVFISTVGFLLAALWKYIFPSNN
jgi:hypothetical protein